MTTNKLAKNILMIAVLGAAAAFFVRAFWKSWIDVRAHAWQFDIVYLILSFIALALNSLLATYGWSYSLNSLSQNVKITYAESVAIVNTNGLLKYIPGKIWPYTMQLYWFSRSGFSRTLVAYVLFINTFASVITFVIVGAAYLVVSPEAASRPAFLAALFISILSALVFIGFNTPVLNRMITVFNAMTGCDVSYVPTSPGQLWYLHGVYLLAAASFGLGALFLARGMGFQLEHGMVLPVMSSMLLSDVAGFLVIISPGGLGVKEGVMYLLLNKAGTGALALMLPVAARFMSMLTDAGIGAVGYALLRRMRNETLP